MGFAPVYKCQLPILVNNLYFPLFLLLSLPLAGAVPSLDDKLILLKFKSSLSDPFGLLSEWDAVKFPDHCTWYGVSCDASYRVVSLNITGNRGFKAGDGGSYVCSSIKFPLYGFGIRRNCKDARGYLVGSLSPIIAQLTELKVLSFPFNGFKGVIPSALWGMDKLEVFDLEGNNISGSLPDSFSGLKNLRVLNLGFNQLKGEIPLSLDSCMNLEILNLAGNQMNGSIPAFVGQFRVVHLSLNQFGGSFPFELGEKCDKLEHLDLSGNSLVGEIPGSLGNCFNLRTLLLYSNMLDKVIPRELGRLKKLEVLDLSRNSLSGKIPPELGSCLSLSVLVLSNSFDPYKHGNSSKREYFPDHVRSGSGEFNLFQGGLPTEISSLPNLHILWAPEATLEGVFPSNWSLCDKLEMLNLAHNYFSGPIPAELGQCQKLFYLNLNSNILDGELDADLPVSCMSVFDVSNNLLSGSIPSFSRSNCLPLPARNLDPTTFLDMSAAYLAFFAENGQLLSYAAYHGGENETVVFHNFGGNKFSGALQSMPISPLRTGKEITYAFLAAENMLNGSFPGILFEKCDQLNAFSVNVSGNRMYGQIPADVNARCSSLSLFDASRNEITGLLPSSIGFLASLVSLNLSWNLVQGPIPASVSLLKNLKDLSLAGNQLNGTIPSSFEEMESLEVLDLSSNLLTGKIPENLVKLRNLNTLLLNDNKLSGELPGGLANKLAFNVSFNNLSGPLPWSDDIMKCSSVLGNPYLVPCHGVSFAVPSDSHGIQEHISPPPPAIRASNAGFNSIEIASIACASAIFSVLLALVAFFLYTRKWGSRSRIIGVTRREVTIFTDIGVPITFENVVQATGSFNASNCIGHGGFGATYKAEISPGILLAIKKLAVGRFQCIQHFHTEIRTLARLHHPNLVTLIGYHASETDMFLIYNYLPGGNLEKFIHERSTRAVDWRVLHKIALDIARALAYLHDQCVPKVLHRDVKPSNILLDEEFNAYLSDFGLAKLLGSSETHATTNVAGTFGYVAPEYAMTCRVSDKADVYSYGVVLLELLSDKKALDPSFSSYGNGFNIVAWGCLLLNQGRAKEFFTSGLWDAGPHDDLVEVLHLAVVCTVESLSRRPTMKQVVRRLKQLQPPSCWPPNHHSLT